MSVQGSQNPTQFREQWAMEPPSNSLQLLDETFSVSESESKATSQK